MKKYCILLSIILLACAGPSEESSIPEDTTTTTIPTVPTIDFNIQEIYNTKLGSELCNDAKEIDTTSEKCLKQYKENLEVVLNYSENIQQYVDKLNIYFDTYPEQLNEEYKSFLNFINTEYVEVKDTFTNVENKYLNRFGGQPSILNILHKNDTVPSGCKLYTEYQTTENTKEINLQYINQFDNELNLKIYETEFNSEISRTINAFSGDFTLNKITATNYLDEEFDLIYDDSFSVTNVYPTITSIEVINGSPDLKADEYVTIRLNYLPGTYFDDVDDFTYIYMGLKYKGQNRNFRDAIYESGSQGGIVYKEKRYIDLNIVFSDSRNPKDDEWATTMPVGPYTNEYEIGFVNIGINNQYQMLLHHNVGNMKRYIDLITDCGNSDSIQGPPIINNEIIINND